VGGGAGREGGLGGFPRSIEGKFVLVVGDRELAERLKVGYLTEEEARELLDYIKKKLKEEAS
jgi:hypothetical protein